MVGQARMVAALFPVARTAWHLSRFVATVSEACALLHIQEDDWNWQKVAPEEALDKESQRQECVPLRMF